MTVVVCLGDFDPVRRRRVDSIPNPKPWPYLHLWGGVRVVILCLIPTDIRLGRGGGACRQASAITQPAAGTTPMP